MSTYNQPTYGFEELMDLIFKMDDTAVEIFGCEKRDIELLEELVYDEYAYYSVSDFGSIQLMMKQRFNELSRIRK